MLHVRHFSLPLHLRPYEILASYQSQYDEEMDFLEVECTQEILIDELGTCYESHLNLNASVHSHCTLARENEMKCIANTAVLLL